MNDKRCSIKSGVTMGTDFWISYTDVMTGLLFIFILIIFCFVYKDNMERLNKSNDKEVDLVTLQREVNELKESLESLDRDRLQLIKENQDLKNQYQDLFLKFNKIQAENNTLNEFKNDISNYKEDWFEGYKADQEIIKLLQKITNELNMKKIKVRLDETNKTLNIYSSVVGFEKGEHKIHENYSVVVSDIAHLLKRELDNSDIKDNIDAIFIEGYTDDDIFYKPEIYGNWGLSSLRAISFWEALNKALSEDDNLRYFKNANQKLLFSVSGYANIRPIDCNEFSSVESIRDKCRDYQKCVMTPHKDQDPNSSCASKLGKDLHDEYDTMNRRIGIRFIPYHKKHN